MSSYSCAELFWTVSRGLASPEDFCWTRTLYCSYGNVLLLVPMHWRTKHWKTISLIEKGSLPIHLKLFVIQCVCILKRYKIQCSRQIQETENAVLY